MSVFMSAKKHGKYWDNLNKALEIIKRLSLDVKSELESKFEDRISGALQPNFKNFIDQRNIQQTMTRITLFGHDHRPDMSIGTNAVAIEVKYIKAGGSFREAIGQSMIYRIGYRFVIIVWVDTTREKVYKNLIQDENSDESKLIKELEENNIYCVIK